LIEEMSRKKSGAAVNVLTHCNAGALATINWGTATAPVYAARQKGINVHVWVDETRPRNQGSQLTAGGHLMQKGQVDLCITGTDRTTRSGDVANKIGTYLKALAAKDNGIPFFVALPSTTIDWTIRDGLTEIPIEERDAREVSHVRGKYSGRRLGNQQLRVRRHAGAPDQRTDHRKGHLQSHRGRSRAPVSRSCRARIMISNGRIEFDRSSTMRVAGSCPKHGLEFYF
jgi:methylthioribose-1-phosphate isomerase